MTYLPIAIVNKKASGAPSHSAIQIRWHKFLTTNLTRGCRPKINGNQESIYITYLCNNSEKFRIFHFYTFFRPTRFQGFGFFVEPRVIEIRPCLFCILSIHGVLQSEYSLADPMHLRVFPSASSGKTKRRDAGHGSIRLLTSRASVWKRGKSAADSRPELTRQRLPSATGRED